MPPVGIKTASGVVEVDTPAVGRAGPDVASQAPKKGDPREAVLLDKSKWINTLADIPKDHWVLADNDLGGYQYKS